MALVSMSWRKTSSTAVGHSQLTGVLMRWQVANDVVMDVAAGASSRRCTDWVTGGLTSAEMCMYVCGLGGTENLTRLTSDPKCAVFCQTTDQYGLRKLSYLELLQLNHYLCWRLLRNIVLTTFIFSKNINPHLNEAKMRQKSTTWCTLRTLRFTCGSNSRASSGIHKKAQVKKPKRE